MIKSRVLVLAVSFAMLATTSLWAKQPSGSRQDQTQQSESGSWLPWWMLPVVVVAVAGGAAVATGKVKLPSSSAKGDCCAAGPSKPAETRNREGSSVDGSAASALPLNTGDGDEKRQSKKSE